MRQRGGSVGAAVGERDPHRDITVGAEFEFSTEDGCARSFRKRFEFGLAFVIAHESAMMLGHAHAEAPLIAAGSAARLCVAFVPSESFRAFLKYLDGREAVVGVARVAGFGARDVHETEFDGIKSDDFGHLVHHAFPRPFRFLLVVTPRRAGTRGVGFVSAPDGAPVRDGGSVELHLIGGAAGVGGVAAEFEIAGADVDFVVDGGDAAVFLRAYFELRDGLGLDLELGEFLIFRQHDFYRLAGHACEMGDGWVKTLGRQARGAESGTVPLIDEADAAGIDAEESARERRARDRCPGPYPRT